MSEATLDALSCMDFPDEAECCNSCHDDFDRGYHESIEMEWRGRTAFVCCGVYNWIEKNP